MTRPVIGIDMSLTRTAMVGMGVGRSPLIQIIRSKPLGASPLSRCARYSAISEPIVELARTYAIDSAPLILIEGYSFNSGRGKDKDGKQRSQRGHVDRAELRGLLIWRLRGVAQNIVEPGPKALKKFTAGNGNASKDDMRAAVRDRWGRDFAKDDEADAYALAMLGLVLVGAAQPETKAQREVVKLLGAQILEAM